jgi:hypothetical protein
MFATSIVYCPLLLCRCHISRSFSLYAPTVSNGGVGIAQGYSAGLRAGWSGVRVPAGAENFSLHYRSQTGSGAHPSSYPVDTRVSFTGGKAVGGGKLTTHVHLVYRSRLRGAIPPLPQYAFMTWYSVKAQGHLYLTFAVCNEQLDLLASRKWKIFIVCVDNAGRNAIMLRFIVQCQDHVVSLFIKLLFLIKWRRMRWVEHVGCMRKWEISKEFWSGNLKRRGSVSDVGVNETVV